MKRRRKKKNYNRIIISIIVMASIGILAVKIVRDIKEKKPEEILIDYMNHIEKQEYPLNSFSKSK